MSNIESLSLNDAQVPSLVASLSTNARTNACHRMSRHGVIDVIPDNFPGVRIGDQTDVRFSLVSREWSVVELSLGLSEPYVHLSAHTALR